MLINHQKSLGEGGGEGEEREEKAKGPFSAKISDRGQKSRPPNEELEDKEELHQLTKDKCSDRVEVI